LSLNATNLDVVSLLVECVVVLDIQYQFE